MAPGLRATCERCRAQISGAALSCPLCGAPRDPAAPEAAPTPADPLIGQVVADRWLLRARIGAGGSGTIYVGEHATVHKRVAVKILHHDLSRDDLAVERFRREATTVAEIDNEHIIEVYDFGRLPDGRMFFAMELLDGETLAAALERGPLPLARAIDILTQIGEALMEAHAMGYVHRDLRPGNVFLDHRRGRNEFVKLFDFGLAKLVERPSADPDLAAASLGMAFGDPRYMSPEQAHGHPADRRADIYSLGAIAYELLTGKPPFVGPSVEILTQHVEATPSPPSVARREVPAWLDAVVLRAMAKQPDDRFVTVYRFIEALRDGAASGRIMGRTTAQSMPSIAPPAPAPRPRAGNGVTAGAFGTTGDYLVPDPDHPASAPLAMAAHKADEPPRSPAAEDPADLGSGPDRQDPGPGSAADTWFDAPAATSSPSWPSTSAGSSREPAPRPRRRRVLGGVIAVVLLAAGGVAAYELFWTRAPSSGTQAPGVASPTASAHATADAGPAVAMATPATPPPRVHPAPREPRPAAHPADGREDIRNRPPVIDFRPPPASAPASPPADDGSDDVDDPASPSEPPTVNPAPAPAPPRPGDAAQAEFFVKMGQKALHDGDTLSAARSFNKAREFDASSADAIAGLGEVALHEGNLADSLVHLDAAARLAPRSARIQILRGQAYLAARQKPLAAAAFRKAIDLDPGNPDAVRGYREASTR